MWLNICIFCVKKLADTVYSYLLYLVNFLASTIVSVTRIALGILVSTNASKGSKHLVAYKVFRSNQFYASGLTIFLSFNEFGYFEILFHIV